jgi:hypothetical protein
MTRKKPRKVMEEYGKRPPPNKGEEFIIANSGHRAVTDVEVGGRKIHLRSSGATVYDRSLAMEIKDKYRHDPNLMVIEKPYRSLNDGHATHWTVPELPWKRAGQEAEKAERAEVPPRVERPADPENIPLSGDDEGGR